MAQALQAQALARLGRRHPLVLHDSSNGGGGVSGSGSGSSRGIAADVVCRRQHQRQFERRRQCQRRLQLSLSLSQRLQCPGGVGNSIIGDFSTSGMNGTVNLRQQPSSRPFCRLVLGSGGRRGTSGRCYAFSGRGGRETVPSLSDIPSSSSSSRNGTNKDNVDLDMDTDVGVVAIDGDGIGQSMDQLVRANLSLEARERDLSEMNLELQMAKDRLDALREEVTAQVDSNRAALRVAEAQADLAEDTLAQLTPVEVTWEGHASAVFVAGSFNGWTQNVELTNFGPPVGSAPEGAHRHFSAELQLFPGVYEIKFIIDGKWTTISGMETKGNPPLENNIIRVK